jgi:uncharacterized protein YggT (Ycf19 family)
MTLVNPVGVPKLARERGQKMDAPLDPRGRVNHEREALPAYPVQPVYQPLGRPDQPPPLPPDSQRHYSQADNTRVETVRQSYYDPSGALVEQQAQVVDDPYIRRRNRLDRIAQIIYFVLGMVEVLLVLRFVLRIINADNTAGFASFIYNFSSPFVAPFNGIFNNDQVFNRAGVVELSTLVAMVIYAVLAYGMVKLLYILFGPERSSQEVYTTSRRRRL